MILSDIGANTLLLSPEVFLEGKRVPNRLELIKEYVAQGGGLVMAGGYLSYQGIYGSARFHRTPIEEVLPVSMLAIDDRIEKPEGIHPSVCQEGSPHHRRSRCNLAISSWIQRSETEGKRGCLGAGRRTPALSHWLL